jgi:hypothetical protein
MLHYNKPASRANNKPLLSVHYMKKCHIVDHIDCRVPLKSKHNKQQPFCVLRGKCDEVSFVVNGALTTALIT